MPQVCDREGMPELQIFGAMVRGAIRDACFGDQSALDWFTTGSFTYWCSLLGADPGHVRMEAFAVIEMNGPLCGKGKGTQVDWNH